MAVKLVSCPDCRVNNALHRTVCRSCVAVLPVSSEQAGYETLGDIVDEATEWYGRSFPLKLGFWPYIFWGFILSLVFYLKGLLAAAFVLGLLVVLYLLILLLGIVLTILDVAAGNIKELTSDLLKIQGDGDYLMRKDKEE